MSESTQPSSGEYGNPNIVLAMASLLNDVGRTFRKQFTDAPKHSDNVERKVWLKIWEKEEAHGMKYVR